MANHHPVVIVDATGKPISNTNPLPTTGGGGGGGIVDQGAPGTPSTAWYIQDGSGLLATAAKQDTGNASLAAISAQLPVTLGQKPEADSLSVVMASGSPSIPVVFFAPPSVLTAPTVSVLVTILPILLLATNIDAKARSICNPGDVDVGIYYGTSPVPRHVLSPGITWEMPMASNGSLEYAGPIYAKVATGNTTLYVTEIV